MSQNLSEIPERKVSEEDREPMRAAVYARTSSARQEFGYSIESQVSKGCEHCEYLGWNVAFIFKDEAESGSDPNRPMFQEMLDAAEKGVIDVLIVWKLDRFSRSLMHAVRLEDQLRKLDVGLYSLTEQIDTTTPAGRFNFRNIASAAEFEADLIQERTRVGLNSLARGHKWPNDSPPLGYNLKQDRTLEIHPTEQSLVKRVFRLYTDVRSMPNVASTLNDENVSTKKGNDWTTGAVGKVLRNELYKGMYEVGDVEDFVSDYQIIDEDLFDEVSSIRLRFQTQRAPVKPMAERRKARFVERILSMYLEYLDGREGE